MAKDDDRQSEAQVAPRVYKASDVHKRRIGKSAHTFAKVEQPEQTAASEPEQKANTPAQMGRMTARSVSQSRAGVAGAAGAAGAASVAGTGSIASTASTGSIASAATTTDFGDIASVVSTTGSAGTAGAADAADTGGIAGAAGVAGAGDTASTASTVDTADAVDTAGTEVHDAADSKSIKSLSFLKRSKRPAVKESGERRLVLRVVLVIVGVVVAALLVLSGFLAATRWLIRDDANSLLGEWYIQGTDVPVIIDGTTIRLNSDTAYAYSIDSTAKTITYRFGNYNGEGHYWFSGDRKYLVITDGTGFTTWSTVFDDLAHGARDLFDDLFGQGAQLPSGDNVIVFSRTPEKTASPMASVFPSEGADAQESVEPVQDNTSTGNVPTGNVPTGNVSTGDVSTGNTSTGESASSNESTESEEEQ